MRGSSSLSRCQKHWQNTSGTRSPCHNPLLMANLPPKSQEKEFMGSLICPGCALLLFHAALVKPSAGSAWTCHFYPLSRGFQTPPGISEGTKGQESCGRVSSVSLRAAGRMPGTTIPSGADAIIGAEGRGAAAWALACRGCGWGNTSHLIKGQNTFK